MLFAQEDRIGTVVADAAARSAAAARLPVMVLALPTPPGTKSAYGSWLKAHEKVDRRQLDRWNNASPPGRGRNFKGRSRQPDKQHIPVA